MTAVLVLPHDAPEADWLAARRKGIGASEISAVLGISPWDSPFSIWWRKRQGWDDTFETEEMSAGKRLEPVVADWWTETEGQRGPWAVTRAGLWANTERPYQMCTPDRLLTLQHPEIEASAVLECKAAFSWDGWTEPDRQGRGLVPVHYRAQVMWQLDCLDLDYGWIAAFSGLSFRSYFITRDEKDVRTMRERAERFTASLAADEPPDVDDHAATLPILRRLNENIEDRKQEISPRVAEGWLRAKRFVDLSKSLSDRYTNALRAELGTAKTATLAGQRFAARTVNDQLRRAS